MICVIGGAFNGKEEYVKKTYKKLKFIDGEELDINNINKVDGVLNLHLYIRKLLKNDINVRSSILMAVTKNKDIIITIDSMGSSLLAMDKFERIYVQTVGEITQMLCEMASQVVELNFGIPKIIKKSMREIKLLICRHGMTKWNKDGRYVGKTDEPLCNEGKKDLLNFNYPKPEILFSSPMLRCIQTAGILFENMDLHTINNIREIDFGAFEGKNYEELRNNSTYKDIITMQLHNELFDIMFPNGESFNDFSKRCILGIEKIANIMIELEKYRGAIVTHGGVIMSIMSALCSEKKGFYNWQIKNGQGVYFKIKLDDWKSGKRQLVLISKEEYNE